MDFGCNILKKSSLPGIRGTAAIILIALCCMAGIPADAAEITASPDGNNSPGLHGLEDFFDEAIPAGLAKYNIPGAVVSVVEDGELTFAKGYGYADIEAKTPVIPDETLFHVGSITKLFTWTAVMQLYEDGLIDLDADVNQYLQDFSIPDTYPGEPVTMRNLMTHSAGFEESEVHFAVADADDLYSFREYCRENIPARVYPPGTVTSYSNYGTTLAAVIIEDVTGIPYESYVADNILSPLEMDKTIIFYPQSPESDENTSSGYHYTGGKNTAVQDTVFTIGPAGTISSTATDMADFVSAHMEEGRFKETEILSEKTAELMHAPAFSNDPGVCSMCLGFYEARINGERIINHGGDTDTFHSLLAIIPERKTGLFVSYNSPGGNQARNDLLTGFVDNYWPEVKNPHETYSEPLSSLQKYAGTYQSTRHNYKTFEFYLSPPDQTEVVQGDESTIYMIRKGNSPAEYTAVSEGVFTLSGGKKSFAGDVVFREDEKGNVDFMCLENIPIFAFERVQWYETTPFTEMVAHTGLLFILSALIWPIIAECRRRYGPADVSSLQENNDKNGIFSYSAPAYALIVAGIASLLFIVFMIFLLPVATGDAVISAYMLEKEVPLTLAAILTVPVIASVLSIIAALLAFPAWTKEWWSLWQRVHYTIVIAGLLMLVWWVNYWNLFVFRL